MMFIMSVRVRCLLSPLETSLSLRCQASLFVEMLFLSSTNAFAGRFSDCGIRRCRCANVIIPFSEIWLSVSFFMSSVVFYSATAGVMEMMVSGVMSR